MRRFCSIVGSNSFASKRVITESIDTCTERYDSHASPANLKDAGAPLTQIGLRGWRIGAGMVGLLHEFGKELLLFLLSKEPNDVVYRIRLLLLLLLLGSSLWILVRLRLLLLLLLLLLSA